MGTTTGRRWPAAAAVVAGGLFLGAGGFGLFRAAHAEPVPAAPPQFRPAAGDGVPGTFDPAVTPALGLVPAAPPPAAIPPRPGDVLPVPPLPSGPRDGRPDPIPMKASDLPSVPVPVEVLPPPRAEVKREVAPTPPVVKLPSARAEPAQPAPAPAAVKEPVRDVLPVPVPVEVPQPAPPAKSAQPPASAPPPPAGLNLQPSEPRLNVKPGEPAPAAPPVTIEFPAAPTIDLNPPPGGSAPVARPTARTNDAPTTSGDAPMSLRDMTRAAVLGTALLAVPALAQDPKPGDPVKQSDLDPIKQQIADLKKDMAGLKDAIEGKADKGGPSDDGLLKSVLKIQTRLEALDKKLQSLENKLADPTRTAGSSPLAGGASPPIVGGPTPPPGIAGRAVVKIVNEYPVEISMLVNGIPHRVEPNFTREVTVVPGTFKYQLLTSGGGEVASPIRDGETVTLRVR